MCNPVTGIPLRSSPTSSRYRQRIPSRMAPMSRLDSTIPRQLTKESPAPFLCKIKITTNDFHIEREIHDFNGQTLLSHKKTVAHVNY